MLNSGNGIVLTPMKMATQCRALLNKAFALRLTKVAPKNYAELNTLFDMMSAFEKSSVSEPSAAEFLARVARSRLLNEERVQLITAKLQRKATAGGLAMQLIKDGELTSFQAKKLLAGQVQGLVIGRFRILKPIGRGGMGVVYLAETTGGKNARVALKILPPRKAAAEPRTKARFLREVAIGRSLPKADNIAQVYETGIVDGVAFIAMEYVAGRTVKSVVTTNGALAIDAAARVFHGVALGLTAVHAKGYVHRDVKPSNIMITPDGSAKLVDFGFALKKNEALTSDPGVVGGVGYALGTFDFIPPEQIANAVAVTAQADQYSLGCSLYYALAAQPPFPGGSAKEKMQKHRWEDPIPLSTYRPDLPRDFTLIVDRLMAKTPGERYPSCAAVAKSLEPFSKSAEVPQDLFTEDYFDGDDLEDLAPFSPTRARSRVYRREQSTLALAVVVIFVVIAIVAGGLAYFLNR